MGEHLAAAVVVTVSQQQVAISISEQVASVP